MNHCWMLCCCTGNKKLNQLNCSNSRIVTPCDSTTSQILCVSCEPFLRCNGRHPIERIVDDPVEHLDQEREFLEQTATSIVFEARNTSVRPHQCLCFGCMFGSCNRRFRHGTVKVPVMIGWNAGSSRQESSTGCVERIFKCLQRSRTCQCMRNVRDGMWLTRGSAHRW